MATVTHHIADQKAQLAIHGRFDFAVHRDFRETYESILATPGIMELDINLLDVDYIDSAALGMLLLLREKALAKNIRMILTHTQGSVYQVLAVANFGRLFNIV